MHYLFFILLAPFLFLQGHKVKKNTPKLPEAAGPREGAVGSGAGLSVLILGDSAAAGVGVASQQQALAGVVVSALAKRYQVDWRLLAKSGYNTAQTIDMLQQALAKQGDMRFEAVVVSLGVNDVLSPLTVNKWIRQQQALIDLIIQELNCRHLILTRVPPMGDFPVLPQPLRWFLGQRSQAFNRQLLRYARQEPRFTLLDFGHQLNCDAMATDGFHPGELIYKDWGKSVVNVLLAQEANSNVN
ncbi:SGNH/GDSL hydrolase family protein [uncultured Shewanella sp.]|uniref:SGNH/GDSL hydrolase family protein n=1 Tax=uncultured Shewanella sp. TaxID=173975 RepID=UPI00262A8E3E|nr:SGNH/GDSL hydrolase family protein [uncultured Shewanella sp.]